MTACAVKFSSSAISFFDERLYFQAACRDHPE